MKFDLPPSESFDYPEFYDSIAAVPTYQVYVEVGVYRGDALRFLAKRLKFYQQMKYKDRFRIHAVDLWDTPREGDTRQDAHRSTLTWEAFNKALDDDDLWGCVRIVKEDSVKAAQLFIDGSVDVVFIDGGHAYEQVLQDIHAWRPKISPGGLLCGHDFGEPCGVEQAVREAFGDKFELRGSVWMERRV